MTELTDLEYAVLEKLLAGDDERLMRLRRQLETAIASKREMTGVGFFTTLEVLDPTHRLDERSVELGDVNAEISGLTHGAGFLLFIRNGLLETLEGYTYGDNRWPEKISSFRLRYDAPEPRNLDGLFSPRSLGGFHGKQAPS